jgi:hypothetical protein
MSMTVSQEPGRFVTGDDKRHGNVLSGAAAAVNFEIASASESTDENRTLIPEDDVLFIARSLASSAIWLY